MLLINKSVTADPQPPPQRCNGERMMGQETRNKLTDYWKNHEVTKDEEYAILTNLIHEEWADVSIKEQKK